MPLVLKQVDPVLVLVPLKITKYFLISLFPPHRTYILQEQLKNMRKPFLYIVRWGKKKTWGVFG